MSPSQEKPSYRTIPCKQELVSKQIVINCNKGEDEDMKAETEPTKTHTHAHARTRTHAHAHTQVVDEPCPLFLSLKRRTQVPLATCVVVALLVALAREIEPLWMAKFVA